MSKCIFCNTENFKKVYKIDGFFIEKCSMCGLVRTIGSSKKYNRYYRDKDYSENRTYFQNIFQKRFNAVSKFKKNGKILEVGSSNGALLELFQENGWQVLGIEPSGSSRFAKQKGIKTLQTTLEKAKIPKNSFDVVVINHTLEHLKNPVKALEKMCSLLKKGGIIYVDVPNFASLDRKVKGKKWKYLLPDEHTFHFTPESLTKILKSVGFTVIKVETKSGIFDVGSIPQKLKLQLISGKPYMYKNLFIDLVSAPANILTTKVLRSGVSLAVIARK